MKTKKRRPKWLDHVEWVYLMKDGQLNDGHFFKIGVANDLWKRRAELATGNPREVIIVLAYAWQGGSGISYQAEEWLHKNFAHKRVRGEWFRLSDDDVMEFIWIAQEELGGWSPIMPEIRS